MKLKQSNAYGIITVIVFLAIIFISWYVLIKPFAIIYDTFEDDYGGDARTLSVMSFTRKTWLILPIILAVGLLIWLITVSTKRDPQQYYLR